MRPTWDEFYLGLALAASTRADCTRSKVGAIIVLRTSRGHLTSIGYNGTYPGEPGCLEGACPRGRLTYQELESNPDYSNCIAFHAEWNAVSNAQFDIEYGDIYVTREPCTDCYIMLHQEGISRVVWPDGMLDLRC